MLEKENLSKGLPTNKEYKVVIIGDGGVGKTTFARRHTIVPSSFRPKYLPIFAVEQYKIPFYTNIGIFTFNLWDPIAHHRSMSLREGFYLNADCAIIMFEVSSRITYRNIPKHYKDLIRICGNIPICLVGNKVDKERKVKLKQMFFHRPRGLQYYDISVKATYQIEKPFMWLMTRLLGYFIKSLIYKIEKQI